ncbi:uncharacterized protein [Montipora capricornis]|uniref:uncharacterized protein n=1 Tax=Montipora capricornis TaxID=246305 RepID=UPI0035F1F50C
MRLTEYFFDENNTTNVNKRENPFHNKSTWNAPTNREQALDTFLDTVKLDITTCKPKPIRDNLTTSERQAIHQLKQRQDIVIKPADKGSGTVIMDKTWYIDECNRQLNNSEFYRRLNEDITVDIQKRVTVYGRMYTDLIDEKTKQYLIQPDVKPGRFYILPKVHKPGNPGRPIVSSNSHPSERISHFIDHHLQPLVHKLSSYVKDTYDFLNKLLTIGKLPSNSLLVTLDVSSLYTNIPHNEGINACDHFLRTDPHNTIPTGTICDLIRMILTMNNFTFNDSHYLQIHGTAMGTKMVPSFANLFLGLFEKNALRNAPFQLHTWHIKALTRLQLRHLRSILNIKWQDHIPDVEVLRRAQTVSVEALIIMSQLRWEGHVRRMVNSRLPKAVFYSELRHGKRSKLRFKDVLKQHLKKTGIPQDTWEEEAAMRVKWRGLLRKAALAVEESARISACICPTTLGNNFKHFPMQELSTFL